MQKTFTNLLDPKIISLTQKTRQSLTKDGLFACKRQKDIFIERLKKGTLFRLASHLKTEAKITSKDPYLNWLEENSTYQSEECPCERTIGETFIYLNNQEIKKQKKLKKPTLPAIQKFKSNHIKLSLHHNSNVQENKKFCLKNQSLQHQTITSKSKLKTKKAGFESRIKSIQSEQKNQNYQKHKKSCFEKNLSKTQFFSSQMNRSFYQDKENIIKSQFYLNDHKKKNGFQTFYSKPQVELEPDTDLKRVKGLQRIYVKSFDQNLIKLEKSASLCCYDEVSTYFKKMKNQVSLILQNSRAVKKQRVTYKDQRYKESIEKSRQRIIINRLNTLNGQKRKSQKQINESHLPEFLLKSLMSPKKRQSLSPLNLSPQLTIRD